MSTTLNTRPVAIIGAGPIGLAAAAHLHERDLPFVVFESGADVASGVKAWGHVRLFSPWRFNLDGAARRLLEAAGWAAPDLDAHPLGDELIRKYLQPLAALPAIAGAIRTNHRVVSITRDGFDKVTTSRRDDVPFVVTTEGPFGVERTLARAVIDSSGTSLSPNPLGADGRDAQGERAIPELIHYGIPDVLGAERGRFAGGRIAVVGSGHSAQNAVRDLVALAGDSPATTVSWVVRRSEPGTMFGGRGDDRLPERGRLGSDAHALVESGRVELVTGFRVREVRLTRGELELVDGNGHGVGPFDRVIAATGSRPDFDFLSELRIDTDPALESARPLAPLIDPNEHSCGSVPPHGAAELAHPETGLYVVGAKSYGRAPTFLMATGYEQVRSIVALLAGDVAASLDVQLVLPETGVCSVARSATTSTSGAGQRGDGINPDIASARIPAAASACCG